MELRLTVLGFLIQIGRLPKKMGFKVYYGDATTTGPTSNRRSWSANIRYSLRFMTQRTTGNLSNSASGKFSNLENPMIQQKTVRTPTNWWKWGHVTKYLPWTLGYFHLRMESDALKKTLWLPAYYWCFELGTKFCESYDEFPLWRSLLNTKTMKKKYISVVKLQIEQQERLLLWRKLTRKNSPWMTAWDSEKHERRFE